MYIIEENSYKVSRRRPEIYMGGLRRADPEKLKTIPRLRCRIKVSMGGDSDFDKYLRAANYLTAAQIFLQSNFLLERELTFDDIKPRLLGHWGSGPGVNFAYSHLSNLAKNRGQEILFVLGPGHAFPSLQANLFLEGTLEKYYPDAKHSYEGIGYL